MNLSIPDGLKLTFVANFIIVGLVGFQHLLFPRVWTDLAGMQIAETVTWRLLGVALISFAATSWMAYRESIWERVRIIVIMEIIWSVLGAIVIFWGILEEGLPPLEWINVILLSAFAISFIYFFARIGISGDKE
jgi:hypothetical protein